MTLKNLLNCICSVKLSFVLFFFYSPVLGLIKLSKLRTQHTHRKSRCALSLSLSLHRACYLTAEWAQMLWPKKTKKQHHIHHWDTLYTPVLKRQVCVCGGVDHRSAHLSSLRPSFMIPFTRHIPSPLGFSLPLGPPLTSACTPAAEELRGEGGGQGHARSRKHPCLACSPDTREKRATQRSRDPSWHATLNTPPLKHLEPPSLWRTDVNGATAWHCVQTIKIVKLWPLRLCWERDTHTRTDRDGERERGWRQRRQEEKDQQRLIVAFLLPTARALLGECVRARRRTSAGVDAWSFSFWGIMRMVCVCVCVHSHKAHGYNFLFK